MSSRELNSWTIGETRNLERLYKRFKVSDLSVVIGRTEASINYMLDSIGIKSPFNKTGNRRIFYAENIANIFELIEQGFSYDDIARCFNVPPKTINQVYRRATRLGFDSYPKRQDLK